MRSRLAGRACRNDASFDAPSPADERLASDSLVVPPLSIVSFYLIASPFLISFQFHPFDLSFLSFFLKDQARRKLHRRKNVEREREREVRRDWTERTLVREWNLAFYRANYH